MGIAKIYEHKNREIIADFELKEGSGFVQASEIEQGSFKIRLCLYRPYNSNDASQSMGDKPYEEDITIPSLKTMRDAISDFITKFEEIK